jgi:hypothetical protein
MGPDFLDAVVKSYELKHGEIIFSDFLWTMRSMYLPLFLANNPETCMEYGENGYKRLIRRYTIVDMKNTYDGIYTELSENMTD